MADRLMRKERRTMFDGKWINEINLLCKLLKYEDSKLRVPVKKFCPKYNPFSAVQLPIDLGMLPSNWLEYKSKISSWGSWWHISCGRLPCKLFLPSPTSLKEEMFKTENGTSPIQVTLFTYQCKCRTTKKKEKEK